MKLKSFLTKLTFVSTLALSAVAAISIASKQGLIEAKAYSPSTTYDVSDTSSELASYYSSISSTATGDTLLSQLRSLNSSKRKTTVGYGSMGTSASGAFSYTDYDPSTTSTDSKGQKYGSKVLSFYTKTSAESFNREHTWPKSHGGNLIEGDIHMTRPTISSENSDRGNSFYVEGKASTTAGWDPYTAGYDIQMRGECARIILYGVVANSQLNVIAADSHSTSNANPDYLMGNMHTLVKWHFDYSPNEYEMNRNNGAQYLQGNRNPFIDHPEYVAKIWSNFDSTVSELCSENADMYSNWNPGSYSTYGNNDAVSVTAPTALTMNKSSATVSYGSTTQLSVTATPSDASATVSWSSSDETIATVDENGLVTAQPKAGTAVITATSAYDSTIKATCTITVPTPSTVNVTSITATAAKSSIVKGGTTEISVVNTPSNAYPTPTYTYSTSSSSVATVNSSGVVTGVNTGTATITVKAYQNSSLKCQTTLQIKVTEKANSIEACYSMADEASVSDVYGLFVGSGDGKSPVIMNGEYGITLYDASQTGWKSWTANETYVKVSGKIDIYNNTLYEIKNYTADVSDQTGNKANVFPVSIYNITGNESSSDVTIASRLCIISGTITSVTNKTSEISAVMTVNSKSINVYLKSNNYSALSSYFVVNNEVTFKGYTTFYSTTFQIYPSEVVTTDASYTAQDFADDLMSMTAEICAQSADKESDLSGIWLTLETDKYAILSSGEKTTLRETVANNNGSDLEVAMARYDFIIAHYASLNNFIGRDVTFVGINNHFLLANRESTTAMIVIITVVGLTGIGAVLFLRRRKEN